VRAAILRAVGETPRIETLADPGAPRGGEVRVRMLRAPINLADRMTISGGYAAMPDLPFVLGAEGVGIVSAIGDGVTNLRVGDHVLPLSRGNWTTLRLLRATDLVRLPADFPIDQAAMLRINPATAWRLLHLARLAPGDWIIQNGARSSVASLVRAFARTSGVNVVNVVREAGAAPSDGVVLEDSPDLPARAASATGGAPISLGLDCVAGASSGRLAACLAAGGQLVVFGHLSGSPSTIPSTVLTGKQLIVRGFSLRPAEAADSSPALQSLYNALAHALAAPDAHTPVAGLHPLEDLDAALQASARGGRIQLALDA